MPARRVAEAEGTVAVGSVSAARRRAGCFAAVALALLLVLAGCGGGDDDISDIDTDGDGVWTGDDAVAWGIIDPETEAAWDRMDAMTEAEGGSLAVALRAIAQTTGTEADCVYLTTDGPNAARSLVKSGSLSKAEGTVSLDAFRKRAREVGCR